MGVTRFPNGVGNHPDNHPLANLPLLDPAVSHTFFEDFDKSFIAADWTVSGTNSITPIVVDGEGGVVDLVTAGADDDAERGAPLRRGRWRPGSRASLRGRSAFDGRVGSGRRRV